MRWDALFYEYKDAGAVVKDGVKYRKYVKVPRFRSKHRAALLKAALLVCAGAALLRLAAALLRPQAPVLHDGGAR